MSKQIQTITGRLGKQPVLYHRNTPKGRCPVAKFSLAVVSFINGKNETVWFQCDAWDGRADLVMKNLRKGDAAQLHGFASTEKFQGKNGPVEYAHFNAVYVTLLGKAKVNMTQPAAAEPVQGALPGLN